MGARHLIGETMGWGCIVGVVLVPSLFVGGWLLGHGVTGLTAALDAMQVAVLGYSG